jgi:hypothetical protein
MEKTAITKEILILANDNRKLRRQTSMVPGEEFLVCVCSRVYGPSEKGMKSRFAISSASRPMSLAWNGRRISRDVSRIIWLNKHKF